MKVTWTKGALSDLRDIVGYIELRNPKAALRVKQRIVMSSRQLREYPHSGTAVHRADARKLVVTGLPYIIIYRTIDGAVDISNVIDARMDRAPDLQ